jgi:hypothetical protein
MIPVQSKGAASPTAPLPLQQRPATASVLMKAAIATGVVSTEALPTTTCLAPARSTPGALDNNCTPTRTPTSPHIVPGPSALTLALKQSSSSMGFPAPTSPASVIPEPHVESEGSSDSLASLSRSVGSADDVTSAAAAERLDAELAASLNKALAAIDGTQRRLPAMSPPSPAAGSPPRYQKAGPPKAGLNGSNGGVLAPEEWRLAAAYFPKRTEGIGAGNSCRAQDAFVRHGTCGSCRGSL